VFVQTALVWKKGVSQSEDDWESSPIELKNSRGDFTLEDDNFSDPIGLNLYYEITDKSGIVKRSDTYFILKQFEELDSTNAIPDLVFGGDVSDYNMISIHLNLFLIKSHSSSAKPLQSMGRTTLNGAWLTTMK
jgi:hypothetical protein